MKLIENQKISQKPLRFFKEYLRVVVSVFVCAGVRVFVCVSVCMGCSCVLMRVCVSLSEFTNSARFISGCEFVGVSSYFATLFYFCMWRQL